MVHSTAISVSECGSKTYPGVGTGLHQNLQHVQPVDTDGVVQRAETLSILLVGRGTNNGQMLLHSSDVTRSEMNRQAKCRSKTYYSPASATCIHQHALRWTLGKTTYLTHSWRDIMAFFISWGTPPIFWLTRRRKFSSL